MKTIENILLAICILWSIIVIFDYSVYTIKRAPAVANLTKKQWKLGFITITILIFYILNNYKLWA